MNIRGTLTLFTMAVVGASTNPAFGQPRPNVPPSPMVLTNSPEEIKKMGSYAFGLRSGKSVKYFDVDESEVIKGMHEGLLGKSPDGGTNLMSDKEVQDWLNKLQELATQTRAKEAEAWLAANKTKEGVKTLPDGLQYKVIREGAGKSPEATNSVLVNYRATLIDGTEFDNTYKQGKPANMNMQAVVSGWSEAVKMMKEGGQMEFYIPPSLGYGVRGRRPKIMPNSVLIFNLELLQVTNPPVTMLKGGIPPAIGTQKPLVTPIPPGQGPGRADVAPRAVSPIIKVSPDGKVETVPDPAAPAPPAPPAAPK